MSMQRPPSWMTRLLRSIGLTLAGRPASGSQSWNVTPKYSGAWPRRAVSMMVLLATTESREAYMPMPE